MKPALSKSKPALFLVLMFIVVSSFAQSPAVVALRNELKNHTTEDTIRVNRLNSLAFETRNKLPQESFTSSHEAIRISQKINYVHGEAVALLSLGFYHRFKGEFGPALTHAQQAMEKFAVLKDTVNMITCMYNISTIISTTGDLYKAFTYSIEGMKLADKINNTKWRILFNTQLGNRFLQLNDRSKAKQYLSNALSIAEKVGDEDGIEHCLDGLGRIAELEGKPEEAMNFYNRRILLAKKLHADRNIIETNLSIAELNINAGKYEQVIASTGQQLKEINAKGFEGLQTWAFSILSRTFLKINKPDSSVAYGLRTLGQITENGTRRRTITQTLGDAYFAKGEYQKAYLYQKEYNNFKDSLNETETVRNIEAIQFTNDLEKKQSEINLLAKNQQLIQETNSQQKKLLWGSGAGIVLLCALLFFLWRNNIQRQKTNILLQQQQEELKATQSQLIQSEKMASLGELTAGIAHEIQNPLNFVNNFSEVNEELISELVDEVGKGNTTEVKIIADDIRQNLQKINHHGKRADAIVKGMLQHSRTNTGNKELTDINALADEYLKLAYHGLRAKDKDFNVILKTDFNNSIGKINIIPQDIGRVLLNLYNNAFYVVNEKEKINPDSDSEKKYEPAVIVATKKEDRKVIITVTDNGDGVPQAVVDKIFQPFFTTKPTGQGTGLGLSLAYDIVKVHGGELKVHSQKGMTIFSVEIPVG